MSTMHSGYWIYRWYYPETKQYKGIIIEEYNYICVYIRYGVRIKFLDQFSFVIMILLGIHKNTRSLFWRYYVRQYSGITTGSKVRVHTWQDHLEAMDGPVDDKYPTCYNYCSGLRNHFETQSLEFSNIM